MSTKYHRLRVAEIALALGLAICLTSGALALRTQERLAEKVVRLHVLANSDTEEDQALKLRVRDVILAEATELLTVSQNRTDAEQRLRAALPELEMLAADEIAAQGYAYQVSAELERTAFPTRAYEGFALPAGEYLALRVLIGEAKGQNWWCVVFPPLCTAAASEVPTAAAAAGFTGEEVSLITEEDGYVLKFKTVELWEALREKLR